MPQLILPIFAKGQTPINDVLYYEKRNKMIYYFNGTQNPVFHHHEDDHRSFRMIAAQFYLGGHASQAEISRAFGIPLITLKRAVKTYQDKGPAGFFEPPKRGGARVLKPAIIAKAEELFEKGKSIKDVANELSIKHDTLSKAVRSGKVKKKNFPLS